MKGQPEGNFFPVSHEVVESDTFRRLSPGAKLLYFVLCHLRNRYAGENGVFFRSDRDLLRDMGYSHPNALVRARKELLRSGFLRWKKGRPPKEATLYQLDD